MVAVLPSKYNICFCPTSPLDYAQGYVRDTLLDLIYFPLIVLEGWLATRSPDRLSGRSVEMPGIEPGSEETLLQRFSEG